MVEEGRGRPAGVGVSGGGPNRGRDAAGLAAANGHWRVWAGTVSAMGLAVRGRSWPWA